MAGRWADEGVALHTGLPADEENARILAHRNSGGWIYPKKDRPNPHLRIPLPAALTPDGWEKRGMTGKLLRNMPEAQNPFVLVSRWRKYAFAMKADATSFLHLKRADGRPGPPWYVLKRETYNRPFPWWDRTVEASEADLLGLLTTSTNTFLAAKGGR